MTKKKAIKNAAAKTAVAKKSAIAKLVKKTVPTSRAPRQQQDERVRVRMYCQGLGDCFLLTFPGDRGSPFHLLIDCGVIIGTPNGDARIKEVLEDIATTTNGKIDLLVGTHEHWDHISGFVQAAQIFAEKIQIKQTWLAWTEDRNDELAKKLRDEREKKKQKLALAVNHFAKCAPADEPENQQPLGTRLAGLVSFFGIEMAAASALEDMGKTARAMEFLRGQNAKFLKPEIKPPPIAELKGIDIFVLGPPTNEKLLKKSLPTKSGHEVYEEDSHKHAFNTVLGLDVPNETGLSDDQPFKQRFSMPLSMAQSDPYYAQVYDNGLPDHASAWRRIDDVGMFAATDLALQLDADTNNTSLVLAFRLPSGKVLLFPGDAQVGSWESWHQITLHDGRTTIKDLIANTVLYKVGHHGSHNATLSTLGLDMMTSPDLVALLPVDEAVAHDKKGWVKMPFVPLMTQLKQRTRGRILRADHDVKHSNTDLDPELTPNWTASKRKFTSDPQRSLYLETFID